MFVIFRLIVIVVLIVSAGQVRAQDTLPLQRINLPPGFNIEVFAGNVPNAREMALGEKGTVFVGTREGSVYAVVNDGRKATRVVTIARGLNMPNGVAFRDGALFVAEVSRITRYDRIEDRLDNPAKPVVVNESFPKRKQHGWKFIGFSPDGMLYVPVGAPCDICKSEDRRFAAVMRMRPDGSGLEIFAEGVRNTVGFDWHPDTGELWFTDNGRDHMGDNIPPDELNRASRPGMHFGFPYVHGSGIPDPEYGSERPQAMEFANPEIALGPHVAALGMCFYTGKQFPDSYHGQILIAEHGSWNRSEPIGYRVTMVRLKENRAVEYSVFADGWLSDGKEWGRPVDVLVMPDGALLVSDDKAGVIYRIGYDKK